MGVRIISGAIGSGKSRMCLDEIDITHGRNPSARCVMIVPDHYSYETEKRFVERFGGTGLNNIEVLTLRRMAINTLTLSELNHLTDAGRQMLIYKAVNECCGELYEVEGTDKRLLSSMRRRGFLDVAASLISEMKRYMVTPEILSEKADEMTGNAPLKNKLTAFSLLYEKYADYAAKSGASDGDDDLRVLARHIEEEDNYDENTYVWIDRFDKFMPQQAAVIEAILKKGAHVTISVCCAENGSETEKELYAETLPTLKAAYRWGEIYGFEGSREAGKALSQQILQFGSVGDMLAMLLIVGVLTGIGEEFVFRGIVQRLLLEKLRNSHAAVWIAAFLFSAIHFQFYGFVPRMLLGAFFGYLLVWSGNIWLPVAAHALNNSFAVLDAYFSENMAASEEIRNWATAGGVWIWLVSLPILAVLLGWLRNRCLHERRR